MATIKMVQNDTAPDLTINVKRSGSAVDLTGATTKFKIQDDSTGTRTNDAHNTCAVVSATGGQVKYVFESGDLPNATSYTCDVEITYGSGHIETATKAVVISARDEV